MTIFLTILIIAALIYLYAALAYYYGFKNWHPMCGGRNGVCAARKASQKESAPKEGR